MSAETIACPGCRLEMPASDAIVYRGYFNASPACWGVFTEVVGTELSNAFLLGQVHQLTVDAYAVQHAGGLHPDKSVAVHLTGLYLVQVRGHRPTNVPRLLQQLVAAVSVWPHFVPPGVTGPRTVFDVAMADSVGDHIAKVEAWARQVWEAWAEHHSQVADFVDEHLASHEAR